MTYIGNELQWKQLVEVDWIGQYVKAWVAFNAWYRNTFPSDLKDWEIIEEIKDDQGNIRSKIENFLSGSGSDSESFQLNVASLHKELTKATVKSSQKRIWLQQIFDYKYVNSIQEIKRGITYKIDINIRGKQRVVRVINSSNQELFNQTINSKDEKYLPEESFPEEWFKDLSPTQRHILDGFLSASSPIHNLLNSSEDYINIGNLKFINNKELIARALIEVLYQLRNALFHGEITPNAEVQRVYQFAYLVLKQIIPGV